MESAAGQVLGLGVRAVHVAKQRQRNDGAVDGLKKNIGDLVSVVEGLEASLGDHPEVLASLKTEIDVVSDYIQRYENPSLTKQGMKLLRPDQVSDTLSAHEEELHQHITRVQLKLMGHLLPLLQEGRQQSGDVMAQLMALTGNIDGINQTIGRLIEKMDSLSTGTSLKPSVSDPSGEMSSLKAKLAQQESVLDTLPPPSVRIKAFSDGTTIKGNVALAKLTQSVVASPDAAVQLAAFSDAVTIEGDVDLGDFSQTITITGDDMSGKETIQDPVASARVLDQASVKGNVGFKTLKQEGGSELSAFSHHSIFHQSITGDSVVQSTSRPFGKSAI